MKKLILIIAIFGLFNVLSYAQNNPKPEKVYSIKIKSYPIEWYEQQAKLWKVEINKNRKNADAWLNYYTANRMCKILNSDLWLEHKQKCFQDLSVIIDSLGKELPNSFEYNYLMYRNSFNEGNKNFEYLQKAYSIAPERSEAYEEFITYYETENDKENLAKFCKKFFDANGISPTIMAWNYNVLMSLEPNAILITNGDNDTYPIWLLQYAQNIRPDVKVFNTSLMALDNYRSVKFKENDIPPLPAKTEADKANGGTVKSLFEEIIDHLVKNHGENPLYFALTVDNSIYKKYENSIYLTGVAFKYSPKDFDNMAVIKRNYEQKFIMDYLKVNLQKDISETVAKQININYMPMLIKLRNHYKLSGEDQKVVVVDNLIFNISSGTSIEDEVKKALKNGDFEKFEF
ncbi:MAG: hypothetical protein WCR42_15150 [bacterium]